MNQIPNVTIEDIDINPKFVLHNMINRKGKLVLSKEEASLLYIELHKFLDDKWIAWKKEYEDIMNWDEFDKKYLWCDTCNSYQEGICICYAR